MEPILRANDEAGAKFVQGYYKIVAQRKLDEQDWIKELRAQGVKACHPNDGWVNRKENKIYLCYPLFNDGVGVGDKIMLGWVNDSNSHRLVEVTEVENSLLTYCHFKDVPKANELLPHVRQQSELLIMRKFDLQRVKFLCWTAFICGAEAKENSIKSDNSDKKLAVCKICKCDMEHRKNISICYGCQTMYM